MEGNEILGIGLIVIGALIIIFGMLVYTNATSSIPTINTFTQYLEGTISGILISIICDVIGIILIIIGALILGILEVRPNYL